MSGGCRVSRHRAEDGGGVNPYQAHCVPESVAPAVATPKRMRVM